MKNTYALTKESGDEDYSIFSAQYIHTLTSKTISVSESLKRNVLILNMSNRIHLSTPEIQNRLLMPYSMAVFPKGTIIDIECVSETEMLLLYFDHLAPQLQKAIYEFRSKSQDYVCSESFPRMKMDQSLKSFATIIIDVYSEFMDNPEFLTNKFAELAFILLKMHPLEEVCYVFSPLFDEIDNVFRSKVLEKYKLSSNVKTLADDCGYTLKKFTQKFKSTFGVSPGEWIKNKQRETIIHLLTKSSLSFQSIADELGMSSQQQLTRFCKRELGITPKELSQKKELSK